MIMYYKIQLSLYFVFVFLVLFSLWDKYLFEAVKYIPTTFNFKRYQMIESRYNLIFNVKRTAVYFMVEDFYCWVFIIYIQYLYPASNRELWAT